MDWALLNVDADRIGKNAIDNVLFDGIKSDFDEIEVQAYSRNSKGLVYGTVNGIKSDVKLDDLTSSAYTIMGEKHRFSEPGDSGSFVTTKGGDELIGYIFAGNDDENISEQRLLSYFIPMEMTLDHMRKVTKKDDLCLYTGNV